MILVKVVKLVVNIDRGFHTLVHLLFTRVMFKKTNYCQNLKSIIHQLWEQS